MIIKKNVKEIICDQCKNEFYYEDSDIKVLNEFELGFICPECGNQIVVEERELIGKFPQDFYHFVNGRKLTDEETQHYIDRVRDELNQSTEKVDFEFMASGDTIVFGTKYDSEYEIYVAKEYYSFSY